MVVTLGVAIFSMGQGASSAAGGFWKRATWRLAA